MLTGLTAALHANNFPTTLADLDGLPLIENDKQQSDFLSHKNPEVFELMHQLKVALPIIHSIEALQGSLPKRTPIDNKTLILSNHRIFCIIKFQQMALK